MVNRSESTKGSFSFELKGTKKNSGTSAKRRSAPTKSVKEFFGILLPAIIRPSKSAKLNTQNKSGMKRSFASREASVSHLYLDSVSVVKAGKTANVALTGVIYNSQRLNIISLTRKTRKTVRMAHFIL
mmetsp:Transcript_13538/g.17650  ORF Transcript_13538/g.17650 Transcript_13538/m.17650 type:complete len:128 (-) Transcript_13538:38-421(-)